MSEVEQTAERPETVVRASIVVRATIEHTFRIFHEDMTSWWPARHHIGQRPMVATILEPRVGGRWYELEDDGSQCEWGIVLTWDPPRHLELSWHIDGDFRYDANAQRSSRVDVRFQSLPNGSTLVELEHSGLDRHGPTWTRLRDGVSGGWSGILQRLADFASDASGS